MIVDRDCGCRVGMYLGWAKLWTWLIVDRVKCRDSTWGAEVSYDRVIVDRNWMSGRNPPEGGQVVDLRGRVVNSRGGDRWIWLGVWEEFA